VNRHGRATGFAWRLYLLVFVGAIFASIAERWGRQPEYWAWGLVVYAAYSLGKWEVRADIRETVAKYTTIIEDITRRRSK
jgi:hypothetical protein